MTHITSNLTMGLSPTVIAKAMKVSDEDADAHPSFAEKIAGLKASRDAARAAHAAAVKSAHDGGGTDVAKCEARISEIELTMKALGGDRASLCHRFACGAVTDEEFDRTERTAETLRRRLVALRAGLRSLKPDVAATSSSVGNYADREEVATADLAEVRARASIEIAKQH